MKILLAQAEIADIVHQALVDYISQKLVISEGTEIQVTMTDDGATIDLVTTARPKTLGEAKAADRKAPSKGDTNVKQFSRGPKTTPVSPVAESIAEPADETIPFDYADLGAATVEAVVEPPNTSGYPAANTVGEPEAEPAAEAAAPPARSLFANLRKPVN